MLKVGVYAICKNEAKFVDRWMDSMNEADLIVVTDTGSTDDTVEKLQQRGATVYKETISPWRFDVARNVSLDHMPEDIDICVCTDLDEIFEPGWRACLEKAWLESIEKKKDTIQRQGRYIYNWSLKADGSPDIQFQYFKIHDRKGFRWHYWVHEVIKYDGTLPLERVDIDGMVLNHFPDATKSRGSYLPLLEMAVADDPMDDRSVYYLGREYMYKGRWDDCIETLQKHLALPTALWKEERCAAMRWIAKSFMEKGDTREALNWYFKAIAEVPHMREPYVECARMLCGNKNWAGCFFMAQEALKIIHKSTVYVNMGYAWDYTPHDLCSLACYYMGLYEKSREYAVEALQIAPEDGRLKNNLLLIENKIEKLKAETSQMNSI